MEAYPHLHLPPCRLTTQQNEGRTDVFDIVRRRYVALTPEEWVRQHVVHALHHHQGYPIELMQVEGTIALGGLTKRCDIVVYNSQMQPLMIVECKKADVSIGQRVVDQICRYNQVLRVPYLFVTNGLDHLVLHADFEQQRLVQLVALPTWQQLTQL